MKTLFSNKRSMSLIRGGITLLTLSILISFFIISPPLAQVQAWKSSKSSTQPNLGTTKSAFSDFCYSYWADGQHALGLNCLKQSTKATRLLQHELSATSFQLWPATDSLSDLVAENLLTNPQTGQPIKTQEDFLAAIPGYYRGLQDLFNRDQEMLSTLWSYKLTASNTPPPPPPVPASDAPPSCPVNSQSFQGADLWSGIGPSLLTTTSNSFQDQNGNHTGVYDIYGRLLLQNHCSIGAFALTMAKLNGQSTTLDRISDWERDTLSAAAYSAALANAPSVKALICLLAQPDNRLIDNWFSAAIITHPISSLTISTATTTSGVTTSDSSSSSSVLPISTISHVEVK
jgi:hypothetical protein